jgi:hypothetical protein
MKEPDIATSVRKEGLTHTDFVDNQLLNNQAAGLPSLDKTPSDDNDVTIQADAIPDELQKTESVGDVAQGNAKQQANQGPVYG